LRFIVFVFVVGLEFFSSLFLKASQTKTKFVAGMFPPVQMERQMEYQNGPYGVLGTKRDRLFCIGCDGDE
jgi:hypothetical protein